MMDLSLRRIQPAPWKQFQCQRHERHVILETVSAVDPCGALSTFCTLAKRGVASIAPAFLVESSAARL